MGYDRGDPLDRVTPGDPLRISASAWNAVMDMVRQQQRGGAQKGRQLPGGAEDSITVLVQNATGQSVPQFGVLGIDSPLIKPADSLPTFSERRAIKGVAPAAGSPFVITQEPIANGSIGRAVILGMTPVQLCYEHGDTFAGPAADVNQLHGSDEGPAQILWVDPSAGTSSQSGSGCTTWALVLLTGANNNSASCATAATRKTVVGLGYSSSGSGSPEELTQIVQIVRCCDCVVLATFCEALPTINCDGFGKNGCGCPCDGPAWLTFTLSGMTAGSGSACASCPQMNVPVCMQINGVSGPCDPNDTQFDTINKFRGGCHWDSNTGLTGSDNPTYGQVDAYPDGSATLYVNSGSLGLADPNCFASALYYCPNFVCGSIPRVFTLVPGSAAGACAGWPPTITVSPAPTNALCLGPPPPSNTCADCAKTGAVVTFATPTNGTCVGCYQFVSPASLSGGCPSYTQSVGGAFVCGASVSAGSITLLDNGVTGWELDFYAGAGVAATYFLAYAGWSCSGANVMNRVGQSGCHFPATVSVILF